MGYRVVIQPTVFILHGTDKKQYGYRLYDDGEQTYNDSWDSIPETPLEILAAVAREWYTDLTVNWTLYKMVYREKLDIFIGDQLFSFDEIKEILIQAKPSVEAQ